MIGEYMNGILLNASSDILVGIKAKLPSFDLLIVIPVEARFEGLNLGSGGLDRINKVKRIGEK